MTNETIKPYGHNTGDITTVVINGRKFITIIDDKGTQRFKGNTAVRAFVDASIVEWEKWLRTDRSQPEPYSLNDLVMGFYEGKHTLDEIIELYSNIGYSLGGFSDASADWDVTIRNPLWEENDYKVLPGKVWVELMGLIGHEYQHNGNEAVRYIFEVHREGNWDTDDKGNFVARNETIDRIVYAYLEKHEIEVEDIEPEEESSDELKTFLTHLKNN